MHLDDFVVFLDGFLGGRLREHPWCMVHPWSMVHGPSMVHGRSMFHGPSSIHGPRRGCRDVKAKHQDLFNVFGCSFSVFFDVF